LVELVFKGRLKATVFFRGLQRSFRAPAPPERLTRVVAFRKSSLTGDDEAVERFAEDEDERWL
jgi:hypothetical protein